MPVTNGNFDQSDLVQTQIAMSQMWKSDTMQSEFIGRADTWKALKKEQNANVQILQDKEKDRDVKVTWLNQCGEQAEACDGDDCDLSGPKVGSDSQVYGLNQCLQYKFNVDEEVQRTNDYNMTQMIAMGMLKADKSLAEGINAVGVARLEAYKGVNKLTDGIGTVNAGTTETDVPAADWNARMFAYLVRVGIINEFSNTFLLSGSNLYEDMLVARLAEGNGEGKGDANLFKLLRTYHDHYGIDVANNPQLKSYLINKGSIAFASKARYPKVPRRYKQQDRWSMASKNLPGVDYDVYYDNVCDGDDNMIHRFKVKARFDYFRNPLGCDTERTGILAFNKV